MSASDGKVEESNFEFKSIDQKDLAQLVRVNQLVDLEWKFGVTASSSELWRVGNTFLQLKFIINKAGQQQDVYMELTLPQFYDFLHEMEKVRNHLEYLS